VRAPPLLGSRNFPCIQSTEHIFSSAIPFHVSTMSLSMLSLTSRIDVVELYQAVKTPRLCSQGRRTFLFSPRVADLANHTLPLPPPLVKPTDNASVLLLNPSCAERTPMIHDADALLLSKLDQNTVTLEEDTGVSVLIKQATDLLCAFIFAALESRLYVLHRR
jgi:hypothetical protein